MNIWMFNHYAITPLYPGGTRHFELGKNLADRGHHVTIFAANYLHMNFSSVTVDAATHYKIEEYGNMRFVWLETPVYEQNDWRRFKNMAAYCRQILRIPKRLVKEGKISNPDVIIGSTVHPFAALTAARIARKLPARFIFEIRDLWPQSFIDTGLWSPSGWQSRVFNFIEKKTVAQAEKIITLSPKTSDYLINRYEYPEKNICYIPNGVNIYTENNMNEKANERLLRDEPTLKTMTELLAKNLFLVLFSGSLVATNKLEILIDAAALLREQKDLVLLLIGKGQEEKKYREMIAAKRLENIMILSPVGKSSVPALLQRAHALILNQGNVQWGSSNKLYDYMASGRPIISSVHARHNDVVADIDGGISIPPENPGALAGAIRQLLVMPTADRTAMGERNKEYVNEYHNWNILAERLEKLLVGKAFKNKR